MLRTLLGFAGKRRHRVVAVFGVSESGCHAAVHYVRAGVPDVPVWLFTTVQPTADTAALCERITVIADPLRLLLRAEAQLWPHWVALSVAPWTGGYKNWAVKAAPFLIFPFRALLLNEHGDFSPGTPPAVVRHAARRTRDRATSGWHRALDLLHACWRLVSYHIWRSGPVTRVKDEAEGLVLLAASVLLRATTAVLGWCRFSRHAWFARVHGTEELRIDCPPTSGNGVAVFRQPKAHWNGKKFEAFLRTSEARWIVWHLGADQPALDDLLPLLESGHTFAVSRQTHFRAWKSMLFPLAPFRALQAGEASQVLAPLSRTIVCDRLKLLALGVPRCSLAGTAWMVLFWKAAAAGWRAYSVGQGTPLSEQPDFPMEETGFVLRAARSRSFRQLGPREPGLGRGAIAFSPRHQAAPAPSGRLKVLVISPFLPYPLSHGGAVRMYNLCRALSDRVDFVLAAMREANEAVDYEKLHEVFREVWIVDKDELPSDDARLPEQVRHHQSRALHAIAADVAARWHPDLLQVEYTHLAAVREAVPDVPAILVEHDLTFTLYEQLAGQSGAGEAARLEYGRWLEFERHWLSAYDGVWTVSHDDRARAILEGGRDADRTFCVPNGVDVERFVPRDQPTAVPEIFYVGSFRHLPNVLGYRVLVGQVMPRVWSRFPDARLRVVAGPQHEMFWQRFAPGDSMMPDPRIEIHGFVEDLRPLYAAASVAVVPLEVSAGTNIKVLEAMACGKAIVTTPVGCAGLGLEDRHDAWIDGDWPAFSQSVGDLLADDGLRRRAGAAARRTAEQRFSWTSIARTAFESYCTLELRATPTSLSHRG